MLHADSNTPEHSLRPRCTYPEPMVYMVRNINNVTFAIEVRVVFGMAKAFDLTMALFS